MINKKRNLLGQILRRYRFENNLTQEDMSKKVGISLNSYNFYESGSRIPNINVLKKLAEICKFDITSILEDSYKKSIKSFCVYSLSNIGIEEINFDDLLTIYKVIEKYKKHKKIGRLNK